jgi:hypothetical protein
MSRTTARRVDIYRLSKVFAYIFKDAQQLSIRKREATATPACELFTFKMWR